MQQYIARRFLLFIPTAVLVTLLVFFFMRIIPGDAAILILAGASGEGTYTEEDLANLRHELGTDKPTHVQYGLWMWDLLRGDLGTSLFYGTSIKDELKDRFPSPWSWLSWAWFSVF